MKNTPKSKAIKMIGENCECLSKHKSVTLTKSYIHYHKVSHMCSITGKKCGPQTTCKGFDEKGKFLFKSKTIS